MRAVLGSFNKLLFWFLLQPYPCLNNPVKTWNVHCLDWNNKSPSWNALSLRMCHCQNSNYYSTWKTNNLEKGDVQNSPIWDFHLWKPLHKADMGWDDNKDISMWFGLALCALTCIPTARWALQQAAQHQVLLRKTGLDKITTAASLMTSHINSSLHFQE